MPSLRVALLYPPPWKIPAAGATPDPVDGPPSNYRQGDLDSDFFQIPYGLLSLAVQARAAGHRVKVMNLAAHDWDSVESTLRHLQADVVGLSCWTANRRGVRLVADAVKRHHPHTHVAVGGPHATPFARPLLEHHANIDTVVIGEGEITFLELLERLAHKRPLSGLPGAAYREHHHIECGPPRPAVGTLDSLESVHRVFPTHILMTSRGCPWACTFCGAENSWGRGSRSFSLPRVLEDLEGALARLPVRMVLIKDDTFTTNRTRILEFCARVRSQNLRFLWSCDTRADVLSEELVRAMRLAGCERMSIGVESGSPQILKAINKKITTDQIVESANLLRRYGIKSRFYMMIGNRGETRRTHEESLEFLQRARPHQYLFSCLSIYPGTKDYEEAKNQGWLNPGAYFAGTFQELKVPFDASNEDATFLSDWFETHRGLHDCHIPSIDELRAVSNALGGSHPPALLDLAEALIEVGELDEANRLLDQAEALEHPLPGLIHNARACIAQQRGDYAGMKDALLTGARVDPQHYLLLKNANAARAWFKSGGPASGVPLVLQAQHDFQLFERTEQPTLPGPLPSNWQSWEHPSSVTLLPDAAPNSVEFVDLTRNGPGSKSRPLNTLTK